MAASGGVTERNRMDRRRRLERADRARTGAAPRRVVRRGSAAESPHVGDDAHRLGAARVAGRGGGHALRDGRAPSLADVAPRPAARRGGRARRAGLDPLLPRRPPPPLPPGYPPPPPP